MGFDQKNWGMTLSFCYSGSLYEIETRFQPTLRGGRAMDPDLLLLQRMKRGDDAAIEEFVRKYYPKILQYCHYHLHNVQDGE